VRLTGDRRAGCGLESAIHEPIDGRSGMIHEQPQNHRVDAVVGDALCIAVMLVGRIFDAVRFLQARPRAADLTGRPAQRAADAMIRFDLQDAGAALRCRDRER
jgi:hypothetical protein